MKVHFHWTAGIRSGVLVLVVGMVLFFVTGMTIDTSCHSDRQDAFGCRIYNGFTTGVGWYTDLFRHIIAPRCVGGNGPDDCIAPDSGIMMVTLFAIGYVYGGFRHRRQTVSPNTSKTSL